MPIQEGTRFLTKSDAAQVYNRSERSLSRDITNAVKAGDADVLKHVRLHLEDGVVRPGTEISIDEIIQLRDDGKNPTWELEAEWLGSQYGKREDAPAADVSNSEQPQVETSADPQEATTNLEAGSSDELQVAVLKAVNAELEKRNSEKDQQIKRLETELDRRAEERREESELQKQNNVLMQQVYNLLIKMQDESGSTLLPRQASQSAGSTIDADVTVDEGKTPAVKTNRKAQPAKKKPATKSAPKRKRFIARNKPRKKVTRTTWADKHLPTLSRYLPTRKR